jgi:hypothetical protein
MGKRLAIGLVLLGAGCVSAGEHRARLHSTKEREFTLGLVQSLVRAGTTPAQVAEAIGSPNIVTRNAEGKETWIYDRVATETSYSEDQSSGFIAGGGLWVPSGGAGAVGGASYSRRAGATATTQRSLTVVLVFGGDGRLESHTYHLSRF